MQTIYIYHLKHPQGEPFYVGRTTCLVGRERKHKLKFGQQILFEVLEKVTEQNKVLKESEWIARYTAQGFTLINKNLRYKKLIKPRYVK